MSFWDTDFGSVLRQLGSNATGGIIGQPGKNVSLSDIFAAGAYVYGSTPKGQQFLSESAGTYVGAKTNDNMFWLVIIAVLGGIIVFLTVNKK